MAINPMTGEVTRTKYRKKGEVVEARRITVYRVRAALSGVEYDVDAAVFEREYERVGEKGETGIAVCSKCVTVITWLAHSHDKDNLPLCLDCVNKQAQKAKPLTLADLKPGDVFTYQVADCKREHQVLAKDAIYCPSYAGALLSGNSEARALLVAHYTLTPKQLLWLDATCAERAALESSIKDKWLRILWGEKRDGGSSDCPCCELVRKRLGPSAAGLGDCAGACLIGRAAPGSTCGGGRHAASIRGGYRAKRAFTVWMAEFLPNIHPLRLEVEATPTEQPGKPK